MSPRWRLGLALAAGLGLSECEGEREKPAANVVEPEVIATHGNVERRARHRDWTPVSPGERLAAEDAIRTGPDARVDLSLGSQSRVTLQAESQIGVIELTEAMGRLKLRRGRLSVIQKAEGERVLRIEGADGQVVEAQGAKFVVRRSPLDLAVATQTGRVDLKSGGAQVAVEAGKQATARVGRAPSAAAPIPRELLLRVARAATEDQGLCALVEGQADPGAEVTVGGEPVALDGAGRFSVAVKRTPQVESVLVVTTDIRGQTRRQRIPCQPAKTATPAKKGSRQGPRKTEPDSPIEDLSIQWGGGPQKGR